MTKHGKASERRASQPASDAEGEPAAQRQEPVTDRPNPVGSSSSSSAGSSVVGPERDTIAKIEGFIRDFEKGKIEKSVASTSIAVAITSAGFTEPSQMRQLHSYYEQLEESDRRRKSRVQAGSRVTEPAHQPAEPDRGRSDTFTSTPIREQHHDEPLRGNRGTDDNRTDPGNIDKATDSFIRDAIYGRKGKEAGDPDPGDDSSSSDDDSSSGESDSDKEKKKKSFKRAKLAWNIHKPTRRRSTDPRCAENTKFFRQYTRNIKKCKRDLLLSPNLPRDFPQSEWEKVLRGELACFDTIISSLHYVGAPQENRGHIGNHEIILGNTKPIRKVETDGQWGIAARAYGRALRFAYPARGDEWDEYMDWIISMFSARPTNEHFRIMQFDKAARGRSGPGTHILLTERHAYEDLKDAIIHSNLYVDNHSGHNGHGGPGGGAGAVSNSGGKQKSNRSCKRWNTRNGCPYDTDSCWNKHVCRNCGGSHQKFNCPANVENRGAVAQQA